MEYLKIKWKAYPIKITSVWKHKKYNLAAITILAVWWNPTRGEELLIGSTTLLDALQPGSFNDENEGFASKEAERIYDEVSSLPI